LLYFLQVEQRAEASGRDPKSAIDWATLVIYTCARSCEQSKAYVEEFVYRQPPAEM
jgi:alkanesulfonate monooxygenase SsuD/methylene tetrahydromethanopterin reductase-like flavin-dependent oxidoreductase (luciferase family)